MKKWLSLTIALMLLISSSGFCRADEAGTSENSSVSADDYRTYIEENGKFNHEVEEVAAVLTKAVASDGAQIKTAEEWEGKKPVLLWENGKGSVTFPLSVPQDGLYQIALEYYLLESSTEAAEIGVLIDGTLPFNGLSNLFLPRIYADDGEVRTDGIGNEFAPEQKEVFAWQEKCLTDAPETIRSHSTILLPPSRLRRFGFARRKKRLPTAKRKVHIRKKDMPVIAARKSVYKGNPLIENPPVI